MAHRAFTRPDYIHVARVLSGKVLAAREDLLTFIAELTPENEAKFLHFSTAALEKKIGILIKDSTREHLAGAPSIVFDTTIHVNLVYTLERLAVIFLGSNTSTKERYFRVLKGV